MQSEVLQRGMHVAHDACPRDDVMRAAVGSLPGRVVEEGRDVRHASAWRVATRCCRLPLSAYRFIGLRSWNG
ncbi:hypothetical protein [Burkholderia pseudomultivorans]|uniref:hypothetical protein n=1 Tax=Burkholderia pseudomultivorans TaxID=1207504 RepID=UPI000B055420|nr:hypothetical protein [Burkholderia pseudomultivorans]